MADQLATPADLALALDVPADVLRMTLLIECATAVVQAITGQRIVEVEDDEIVLDLDGYDCGLYLPLPERPVTAVSAVSVGATAATDYRTQLRRGRLWRAYGWRSTLVRYPLSEPSTVTVTYTHGYPTGHQKLQLARSAVLGLSGHVYINPTGVTQERLDDYSVTYEAMMARAEASPFLVAALRKQYARPNQSVRLIAARS